MIRTILERNIEAGTARIRFEHNDITVEQDYTLIHLVPGTEYVLASMGMTFDETFQDKAIDYLEASILRQIEDGLIANMALPEQPAYEAPPEPAPEPTPEAEEPKTPEEEAE